MTIYFSNTGAFHNHNVLQQYIEMLGLNGNLMRTQWQQLQLFHTPSNCFIHIGYYKILDNTALFYSMDHELLSIEEIVEQFEIPCPRCYQHYTLKEGELTCGCMSVEI